MIDLQSSDNFTGLRKYLVEAGPFPGEVLSNLDPERRGRCKIRIWDVYGDLPEEFLPWVSPERGLDGKAFNIPDIGKIVYSEFPLGDMYHPQYMMVENYSGALLNKLDEYITKDKLYQSFTALCFDQNIQVWSDSDAGLVLDYGASKMIIKPDNSINMELKSPSNKLNLGHADSNQSVMLGNNFLDWFDEFMQHQMGSYLGPFIGNLGAPVLPNPAFLQVCQKYFSLRNTKFLSKYVFTRDNQPWNPLKHVSTNKKKGDA